MTEKMAKLVNKEVTQIRTISDVVLKEWEDYKEYDESKDTRVKLNFITSEESCSALRTLMNQGWHLQLQLARKEEIQYLRKQEVSEYGEGIIYPFVLGLIHVAEGVVGSISDDRLVTFVEMFFASASDHLLGILLADHLPADSYALMEEVKEFAIKSRHRSYTDPKQAREVFEAFMKLVRELAFSLDRSYGNVPVKATWD